MVRHQGEGDGDLLRPAWTTFLILVLAVYGIIAAADPASAEPVECPSGHVWNPQAVTCVLTVSAPSTRHDGSRHAKAVRLTAGHQ